MPPPPSRRSAPAPPSSPSLPGPPARTSSPSPPSSPHDSVSGPQRSTSSPAPPSTENCPRTPSTVTSSLPSPASTSAPSAWAGGGTVQRTLPSGCATQPMPAVSGVPPESETVRAAITAYVAETGSARTVSTLRSPGPARTRTSAYVSIDPCGPAPLWLVVSVTVAAEADGAATASRAAVSVVARESIGALQRTARPEVAVPSAPVPFAESLLEWYAREARDLPWRRTRDPYAILVSEVMLQQTQVARVVPRYEAWLERWPTAKSLAAAPVADVLAEWVGLGYNRRALRLREACAVVARAGWPRDAEGLRRLPGVGPYTAAAVASFAFGQRVAAVDTNVRRVAQRIGVAPAELLPERRHADWNQAAMELGARVCRARAPSCDGCPAAPWCGSRGRVEVAPRAAGATAPRFE